MPDRYEQTRDELVKGGIGYEEAQTAKLPEEPPKPSKAEVKPKPSKG